MKDYSLRNEYEKLSPGVVKVFVVPQIPVKNRNTSYLCQLYKEFLKNSFPIKIETFNAASLPKIFFSSLKSEKSILHYHWFEFEDLKSLIGIKWKFFWIILYKIMGGKLIWTVHNRIPHHNKYIFLNKKIRKLFALLANKLHVHCESAIGQVIVILNVTKEKFFVVKHPEFPADIFEKEKAIEGLNQKYFNNQLKTDDKIFLMFGAIAEYKCIKEVIEIFTSLNERNKLLIAGFIKKGNFSYFKELKKISDKRKIFLEGSLIPDEDVPYFLNSADFCIFNYKDILASGGVHLALSYNKQVILPRTGCLKELNGNNIYFFEMKENRKENLKRIITEFIY